DTVEVVIQLAGDAANAGVSADVDIRFPTDVVAFDPPVSAHCRVASRVAATHQIGGQIPEPGLLSLALFVRNLSVVPLGDGALVTCDFRILASAALGTAPLTVEYAGLGSAAGAELPVAGVSGAITIGTAPVCTGDCDGDARIAIDELVRGVRIALHEFDLDVCPAADASGDQAVSVTELIQAVNNSLQGCPAAQ
ncbi:MAG: hypothetical protein ABI629_26210, partial [bacterium]